MKTTPMKHILHHMLARREVQLDDATIPDGPRRDAIDKEAAAIEEALERLELIDDAMLADKKERLRERMSAPQSRKVAA